MNSNIELFRALSAKHEENILLVEMLESLCLATMVLIDEIVPAIASGEEIEAARLQAIEVVERAQRKANGLDIA